MNSPKLNVLVAYPYMKQGLIQALVKHQHKINFLLDSGAFTAWNAGKPIALDDYCRFLDSLPFKPWRYFALDVIGDPVKTMENYKTMLARGYNPIPVFTPSQDFADIEEYYKTTDMIGCGGLTTKYGAESVKYLRKVFQHVHGRKIHLLGYTKPEYVKHFRPFSCDSSSWTRAQRYGLCDLYVGQGKYLSFTRRQAAQHPKPHILEAIKRLGFTLTDFMTEANWRKSRNIARVASARSWVKYMIDAEKAINTKIFLALGAVDDLELAIENWEYWNEHRSA